LGERRKGDLRRSDQKNVLGGGNKGRYDGRPTIVKKRSNYNVEGVRAQGE